MCIFEILEHFLKILANCVHLLRSWAIGGGRNGDINVIYPKYCKHAYFDAKKYILNQKLTLFSLKPSLSGQWSCVQSFVRDFVCISFAWLTSLWEQSQTKLMQKKSRTKLHTRLHLLERLGFSAPSAITRIFPHWPMDFTL